MFTEQHYKVITEIISNPFVDASDFHDGCMGTDKILFRNELVNRLVNYFAKDNPNFDKDKFLKACGVADN